MLVSVHTTKYYLSVVISFKDHPGGIRWEVFRKFLLIYLLFAVWTLQGELKHLVDITETRCIEFEWVWVSVKETYWRNHSNNSNNNNK